jgi:hypothetical protein
MEALECLPVLNALGVYALSFWERSYWVNKERYGYFRNAIWETLFPQISRKV